MAVMYFTQSGISWIRHRFLMSRDFIAGVIARQIVDFDLVGSATTRFAAHELGHIILHRSQLKMAPMQDDTLYNMTDNTEYQANLFAADLLIDDEEIEDMVQNEDLDYFGLCSSLNATPELMSFKLYSLTKRGQAYHMPMEIQSNFLAK